MELIEFLNESSAFQHGDDKSSTTKTVFVAEKTKDTEGEMASTGNNLQMAQQNYQLQKKIKTLEKRLQNEINRNNKPKPFESRSNRQNDKNATQKGQKNREINNSEVRPVREASNNQKNNSQIQCFYCSYQGHMVRDCCMRKRERQAGVWRRSKDDEPLSKEKFDIAEAKRRNEVNKAKEANHAGRPANDEESDSDSEDLQVSQKDRDFLNNTGRQRLN